MMNSSAFLNYCETEQLNGVTVKGDIYLKSSYPPVLSDGYLTINNINRIYIPKGSMESYYKDSFWKEISYILEEYDYSKSVF